jgi:hypothetical protein
MSLAGVEGRPRAVARGAPDRAAPRSPALWDRLERPARLECEVNAVAFLDKAPPAANPIDAALAIVEAEASIPVVPGNSGRWCGTLLRAIEHIEGPWGGFVRDHEQTLKETLETDLDLASRIQKAKARLDVLVREIDRLKRSAALLKEESDPAKNDGESGEPTSKEPTAKVEALRKDILAWIVNCRALTKEVETWFLEASYRDTGSGD